MGRTWWLLLNAFAVSVIYAAPRELSTDELITKPRPGEEYVHIQTSSKDKIDLVDKSFTTSHRIPEVSKTNRTQDFQTSHKIPLQLERSGRSLPQQEPHYEAESNQRVVYSVAEGTTNEPPLERVVTRTSVKMSKSKKVQKSVLKTAHDGEFTSTIVDIKANEGLIDERPKADDEEREIMRKKFSKNEKVESASEEFSPPTRFNVPFEDEEKAIDFDTSHLIIPNPVIATTQEPPITTFNYKNVYDKTRKGKGFVTNIENAQDKYKYETVSSEFIKTAESKTITSKKDTKQEKKDKYNAKDKEESGFYVLPVNKQHENFKEDNYDFVDVEEKVLVPAGSSPSQSSRINIKKGPNGQEYEYEYVYYYYDEDDETPNGGSAPKEGKVVASTTEKVFNSHDGPAREDQEQNSVQSTSTNGNKYLPTESLKPASKTKSKTQIEVTEEIEDDIPPQNFVPKNSRGGSNGSGRFSSSGRQSESTRTSEPANNEVYPSGRTQSRSRGRGSSSAAAPEEEIPSIGEERLPANTRFPPRSRVNNAPVTPPQTQETTTRTRVREGGNQSRLRIPNLGLLDSSSFRTHASDASIEDDALRESELQKKANARGQSTETSYRRGTRPTTITPTENQDVPAVTRRPTIRKPVEDRRPRPTIEEEADVTQEKRFKASFEDDERTLKLSQEEREKRPRVPLEEEEETVRTSKVPLEEEQEIGRPQIPSEGGRSREEQRQKEVSSENSLQGERRLQPQTTRESDAEEGVFVNSQVENTSEQQSATDHSGNQEIRTPISTTEDPSAPGLTNAMMEKVALDLYAILQQAQNENIRTNFVDGNSTDVTTDLGEEQTEFSTDGEGPTAEPVTTTTTTTTTTPPPTTTTTTTTPAPTPAVGRGRYRGRVGNGNKIRPKGTTTTTTEAPEEVTSPRTRGRFQPSHGTRGSGLTFARKPIKSLAKEQTPEETPASEETPKATPERTFGDRPRSRFRTSGKETTSAPTTTAPAAAPAAGNFAAGSRGVSVDRAHSRRRGGGRAGLPVPQHSAAEPHAEEEKQDAHQETAGLTEEVTPSSSLRPTRPRIGGSARPLRPGPRAPLILPQRGHQAVASSTALPVEHEEIEREVVETEVQAQQSHEEAHEAQTTPAGDALTRLKSRPRLRIGANTNHQRPQSLPPSPPQNRRKLVSSLLPKRKPNEEKPVEKLEETDERGVPEEIPVEEDLASAPVEPPSSTAEPEAKGLSGLLAGRRRNLNRRPGTIYNRAQLAEA